MKEKGIKSIIGKMGILLALIVVCVFPCNRHQGTVRNF